MQQYLKPGSYFFNCDRETADVRVRAFRKEGEDLFLQNKMRFLFFLFHFFSSKMTRVQKKSYAVSSNRTKMRVLA